MLQYATLRTWHVMIPCLAASEIQSALTKYSLNRSFFIYMYLLQGMLLTTTLLESEMIQVGVVQLIY